MNVARIRGFLIQLPKPSSVRYTVGDGESQPLKLNRSYAKLAATIDALGVELLECFDAQGVLLRAMRFTDEDAQRSNAAAIPKGIEVDPQALMLTHFANLLHRAYEHSTEIAFAKMVEITAIMSERSEAIEQRLERTESHNRKLQQDQIDEAYERAEEEAARKAEEAAGGVDFVQQMAGAFLGGKGNGAAAQTNGKGKGAH